MTTFLIGVGIGLSVGFPTYLVLCTLGEAWLGLGMMALILPTPVGALLGHLRALRRRSGVSGVVSLHRRELVDYLAPLELWVTRSSSVVPLAVAALGSEPGWGSRGTRRPSP